MSDIETRTGLEPALPPFCRRCPRPFIGYLVILDTYMDIVSRFASMSPAQDSNLDTLVSIGF